MLTKIIENSVLNVELSRRKLLYYKTVYSRKIIQLSEELDIDDIPGMDFDEPFQSFETVEQELAHLRLRVKKLQGIVHHLKVCLDEKEEREYQRLRKLQNNYRQKFLGNNSLNSPYKQGNLKIIRKVASKRFPRKAMSGPREMLIKKLKRGYERKARELGEFHQVLHRLRRNPVISIKTIVVQPDGHVEEEIVPNKFQVVKAAVKPVLSLEEITAFLQKMCQPLPEPLSPIKSPEREIECPFSITSAGILGLSYGTGSQGASRELNFNDVSNEYDNLRKGDDFEEMVANEVSNTEVPIDLNSELITNAIVTSLNV